jgi:hypothetical protein
VATYKWYVVAGAVRVVVVVVAVVGDDVVVVGDDVVVAGDDVVVVGDDVESVVVVDVVSVVLGYRPLPFPLV